MSDDEDMSLGAMLAAAGPSAAVAPSAPPPRPAPASSSSAAGPTSASAAPAAAPPAAPKPPAAAPKPVTVPAPSAAKPPAASDSKDKKKDDLGTAEIEEKRGHYERKVERALKKGDKEKAAEYQKKLSKLPPRPAGMAAPPPKPKEAERRRETDVSKPAKRAKVDGTGAGGSSRAEEESSKRVSSYAVLESGARDIDPDRPLKEQAVEAILVRWQYAGIQWDPAPPGTPAPAGFLAIGFPGVYVGVKEEVLGVIRDSRPTVGRPSADYLHTLPSQKLKEMWREAINNQRTALIAAEGERAPVLKLLRDELRTVEKFDADRAERQYAKKVSRVGGAGAGVSGGVGTGAGTGARAGGEGAGSGGAAGAAAAGASSLNKAARVINDDD